MAIACDGASSRATKSVRGMRAWLAGNRPLPAYGSIEMRPIIHASPPRLAAVRSYSAESVPDTGQCAVTMRPSMDGTMWQITYGRSEAPRRGRVTAQHLR
jgi:hypothetical protein